MPQSNISIRIDDKLKQQFDSLCDELGLTMSTAINIFVKTVVREKGIPFEVSLTPNLETRKALDETEKNRQISKTFKTTNELFEDLDA